MSVILPHQLGMTAHICAMQEVEAGGPEAESQPQLPSEFEASILHEHLSQKEGCGTEEGTPRTGIWGVLV